MLPNTQKKMSTRTMVLGAMLTALVVVLQMMGGFIRFGTFQVSLVLLPIVIGAATCGVGVGAWLGLVFGVVVLLNGDASPFLAIHVPGTVITVLAKGTACGAVAAVTFKLLEKVNRYLAVLVAAIVCPVVNTGVFLLGCWAFFFETIEAWGTAGGFENVGKYIIFGLVGGNFLFELGANILLSPVIVRLLDLYHRGKNKKKA